MSISQRPLRTALRAAPTLIGALLLAQLATATAGRAAAPETYRLSGYEIWFAPTVGVFAGSGSGVAGELSGWYSSIEHSGVISPIGSITGGWAVLHRPDGVRIGGWFDGGTLEQTNPGAGCTTETHAVRGTLSGITRSDSTDIGTGLFEATLTHHRAWIFGTCISYSATVSGTISLF